MGGTDYALLSGHPVSVPQAGVRREKHLSQGPTSVTSRLSKRDANLCREKLENQSFVFSPSGG